VDTGQPDRGVAVRRSTRRSAPGGPGAGRWWVGTAALFGVAVAVLALVRWAPVAAALAVVGSVIAVRAARAQARRSRRRRDRRDAEEMLAALAAELEAGAPPAVALLAAIGGAGTTGHDSSAGGGGPGEGSPAPARARGRADARAELAAALRRGAQPADALSALPAGPMRQLAVGWRVHALAGVPLADLARRLAAVARVDLERMAEIDSALAGPRASGRMVASLPALGVALGGLLGAHPVRILLRTPAGAFALAVGVLLDCAGLAWVAAIARRAERDERAAAGYLLSDLPLGLDLISVSLRAGTPVATAITCVGTALEGVLGRELTRLGGRLAEGIPAALATIELGWASPAPVLAAALGRGLSPGGQAGAAAPGAARTGRLARAWAAGRALAAHAAGRLPGRRAREPDAGVVAFTRALGRAERSGARLATVLAGLAERRRAEIRAHALLRAHRAAVRAIAPVGLCFLPAFVAIGVIPVIIGAAGGLVPAGFALGLPHPRPR